MGFSADWLALREPADHAARDTALLHAAVAAAGPEPVILDLGCGTGSTVRALSPLLPHGATWHLVDNDRELLERAGAEVGGAATLHCQDIWAQDTLPLDRATLVTASALIDLVSKQWLSDVVARLHVPVYFALSYNGVMSWAPDDFRDAAVTEAFNDHQRGDKGLGPALGPESVTAAHDIFTAAGFDVRVADSPWQLGPEDAQLQRALVAGIADAAAQAGEADANAWGVRRVSAAASAACTIGHGDILALPKTREMGAAYAQR